MPRTLVAAQLTGGSYPVLPVAPGSRALTLVAGDVANGNFTPLLEARTLVLVRNTGAGARTITFTSVKGPATLERSGDITAYSLAAGTFALFGPFRIAGWSNAGNLDINVEHAEVTLAIITLP